MARALAQQSELKKEQEEVSRLKAELEKVQSRNAELEKSAAEEKQLRVEETRKLNESLEESKSRTTSAESELGDLKAKIAQWLVDISGINSEMNSRPLPLLSLLNFLLISLCDLSRRQPFPTQNASLTPRQPRTRAPQSNGSRKSRMALSRLNGIWMLTWRP